MTQEYIMLPKTELGRNMTFEILIVDKSMAGAGMMPGDNVTVLMRSAAVSGEVVLVEKEGHFMLRAYYCDEAGNQLLLACDNAKASVPLLLDGENVRLVGVVVEHSRYNPVVSAQCIAQQLDKIQSHTPRFCPIDVSDVIRHFAPSIRKRRLWYAVYRALVDVNAISEDMFVTFVHIVRQSVPHHKYLPTVDYLRRMAVQSFCKPISQWDINNAPVNGVRFEQYHMLACAVKEYCLK